MFSFQGNVVIITMQGIACPNTFAILNCWCLKLYEISDLVLFYFSMNATVCEMIVFSSTLQKKCVNKLFEISIQFHLQMSVCTNM